MDKKDDCVEDRSWVVLMMDNYHMKWYKIDISPFVKRILKTCSARVPPRNAVNHRCHGSSFYFVESDTTDNTYAFEEITPKIVEPVKSKEEEPVVAVESKKEMKKKKKQEKKEEKKKVFIPTPNNLASYECIPPTIYCVGGDTGIQGFNKLVAHRFGGTRYYPTDYSITLLENDRDDYLNTCLIDVVDAHNLSHVMVQADVSSSSPSWLYCTPLVSPRYCPNLLSFAGKLFLFGGNCPPSKDDNFTAPFAEVFDPETGLCTPLPQPFFDRIPVWYLNVLPLLGNKGEQKILLMSRICSGCGDQSDAATAGLLVVYDIKEQTWTKWEDPDSILYEGLDYIFSPAVAVAYNNTSYWLEGRYSETGKICCYNWKTKKFLEGPFRCGLQKEGPFQYFKENPKFLFHLTVNLFCILWVDYTVDEHTCFHFSVLYLHKSINNENNSDSLQAHLLGCLKFEVDHCVLVESA